MRTRFSPHVTGYAAAWCIVLVWSFWLIVSRLANGSGLTIYDLAALRYGLAAVIAGPLCLYYRPWRGLRLFQIAVLSFVLGPVYILFVFAGFIYAPAAHGGIFMNGVLPIFQYVAEHRPYTRLPKQEAGVRRAAHSCVRNCFGVECK